MSKSLQPHELYVKVKSLRPVILFVTPWTVTFQALLTMGFPRHDCWSGLPFPSPEDLPNPGIKPGSPELQADPLPSEPPGKPHELYSTWNSLDQNTRVGSLSLLQEIFPAQGSNPVLLPCRLILYQLSHKGSPIILEWVAYPFSRGSSRFRNRTGVFCIAADYLPTELSGKPT